MISSQVYRLKRGRDILSRFRRLQCNLLVNGKKKHQQATNEESSESEDSLEKKIIFNSILEGRSPTLTSRATRSLRWKLAREKDEKLKAGTLSGSSALFLKYITEEKPVEAKEPIQYHVSQETVDDYPVHFPFQTKNIDIDESISEKESEVKETDDSETLQWRDLRDEPKIKSGKVQWYLHQLLEESEAKSEAFIPDDMTFSNCNPDVPVSSIPCGGCGALLHCQDKGIPGFMPEQAFMGMSQKYLKSQICQRCHFLKEYNVALGVNVSAEDYPKIISHIQDKRALVVLLVDLLDFPCSIWPDILNIIGTKRPVLVVANKIDLLIQDGDWFLKQVSESVRESLLNSGLSKANIKEILLISAKTGYNLEALITKIHVNWGYQGDVYILGCTNAGKSTLFNALIQSDLCKVQAIDLVQRATISTWPGTTLNLLKFPILRPSQWRLYMRTKRIEALNKEQKVLDAIRSSELKKTNYRHQRALEGTVGRTFAPNTEHHDVFANRPSLTLPSFKKFGIDENDKDYIHSKWCYDTPGVVQPDQIINLLTTDELGFVLPKTMLFPRNISVYPGLTVFLAGIGRVDFLGDVKQAWFTVFASDKLPITVTKTEDADYVYKELLGSDLFVVPTGQRERLASWPDLKCKRLEIGGLDREIAAGDLILSSAGWITITASAGSRCKMDVWTPEGRGIFMRKPSIYRMVKNIRSERIKNTTVYRQAVRLDLK